MTATLLEMTQDILSAMDSDEVDSIHDTAESLQVANAIKDSYNYLLRSIDLPENYNMFELKELNNPLYPHIMKLPYNCDEVVWVKYNTEPDNGTLSEYTDVEYLEKDDFFDRMYNLHTESSVVEVDYTLSGAPIATFYRTDRHPSYYTGLSDRLLIFDAVNLDVDDVLKKDKTIAYGKLRLDFFLDDTYTPNLNDKQYTLLYNEAKSQCFIELKQQANPVSERRLRKGWIRSQKAKDSIQDPYENYRNWANYGRRK